MPELPEVETIARGLRAALLGAEISRVVAKRRDYVRAPRCLAPARLVGRSIDSVSRHGKQLRLALQPSGSVILHLGMSGQVTLQDPADPVAKHTHFRVAFQDGAPELRVRDARRFGGVWIVSEAGEVAGVPGARGPDALSLGIREFRELMTRRRQVKALLLDQNAIAGLGNIYCDEALFAARIHPSTRAAGLDEKRVLALHRAIRRILRSAIRHGGSTLRDYRTASGDSGGFQSRHLVYGRAGEPCPRCASPIRRIQIASRSSHLCARCQRGQT